MRLLAKQLQLLKPDIIACQECFLFKKKNIDTLNFLAGNLKMNAVFTGGRLKERYFDGDTAESQSGLGILSLFPVNVVNEFRLPTVPEDNDRKIQQAEITLPSGLKLMINNVHLTHLKDKQLKQRQAEALAEAVSNKNYGYTIVCGDFNSTIDSEPVNFLKRRLNAVDCYAKGNGTEPRFSLLDPYLEHRLICVDHIFAIPQNDESRYQFVNSSIVLNEGDGNGLYPSDHFGITTTLITD
jgi:endonuclease/exonuclease/phosphatase family metal-dependent hydrolase